MCERNRLLCIFHNTCWTHFIFIHLIKELPNVCCMLIFFCKIPKFDFLAFFFICNFDVLFWLRMKGIRYVQMIWIIVGWGYSRNAGILVALVLDNIKMYLRLISFLLWYCTCDIALIWGGNNGPRKLMADLGTCIYDGDRDGMASWSYDCRGNGLIGDYYAIWLTLWVLGPGVLRKVHAR